jgi:hypothetical protein
VDFRTLGGGSTQRAAAQARLQQLFAMADVTSIGQEALCAGIPAGHFSALVSSRPALCDRVNDAVEKQ